MCLITRAGRTGVIGTMQAVDQSLTMKHYSCWARGRRKDTNERACITSSRANFSDACGGP